MSSKTYKMRGLVLRKTKLREKDLIVTMLDESGALVKGVAKGARRPGGSLAARLELFSTVDALMAQGRSLDVVCEARLDPSAPAPAGLEQTSCAAPVAELLCLVAQPDLAQPRLFDLSRTAMTCIAGSHDGDGLALAACAAAIWKVMAQSGYRPSFGSCALCGREGVIAEGPVTAVSPVEGGVVCGGCPRPADALVVSIEVVRWCDALIASRFVEIAGFGMDAATAFEVLHLARLWVQAHTGRDLSSLGFLFTSGVF